LAILINNKWSIIYDKIIKSPICVSVFFCLKWWISPKRKLSVIGISIFLLPSESINKSNKKLFKQRIGYKPPQAWMVATKCTLQSPMCNFCKIIGSIPTVECSCIYTPDGHSKARFSSGSVVHFLYMYDFQFLLELGYPHQCGFVLYN